MFLCCRFIEEELRCELVCLGGSSEQSELEVNVHRSDRISERLSFSSTKYGPSVRAAVRTQLLPVVVSVVGSVTPAVEIVPFIMDTRME